MPSHCDGCGSTFDLSHALDCQRHNEVRDALGDLVVLVCKDVICEPIVCEGSDTAPTLIVNLEIRGVWLPQIEALLTFELQMLMHRLICPAL